MRHEKMFLAVVACLALSAGLIACQSQGPGTGSGLASDSQTTGIFGGEVVMPQSGVARATFGIYNKASGLGCGATLFEPTRTYLMTAAHCLRSANRYDLKVYLSADLRDLNRLPLNYYRDITQINIHPAYNAQATLNDIAILKMDMPAPDWTVPMTLATEIPSVEAVPQLWLAGYGAKNVREELNPQTNQKEYKPEWQSSLLRETRVPRVQSEFAGFIQIDQTQGSGACLGDSGGPAYIVRDNKFILLGIISSGDPRGGAVLCRGRGLIVPVARYLSWFQSVVAKEN